MNISYLKLQKASDGRFLLSKEAVNVLKKAKSITVSYNRKVKSECFIMAEVEVKKYVQFDMQWIMPINTLEQQFMFRSTVALHSRHPLQELIKADCELIFIPTQDGLYDTIRFMISKGTKIINGVFTQKIAKSEHDPLRMINPND